MTLAINRRGFLGATAAAGLAAALPASAQGQAGPIDTGINTGIWTPEYIERLAGTASFDTAAECARIVPLDYKGRLTYWYAGPTQASTQIEQQIDAQFWQAFAKTYPNIRVEKQNLDYNSMLNKLRTAALGNSAPMVAKLPIMWGVEFAAKEQLHPLRPEDVGYPSTDFWPAAMKSVTWQAKTYGVPTNNETMGLIWNAELFRRAGLNPEEPPPTWSDLREYSRLIKAKTRKNGYGMVARVNAGNTPFRYMPQCWAFGGGALDETATHPTYDMIMIDNAGAIAALQLSYDMYDVDHSVPFSALTNTQNENENPFIAGQLAMMIGHPLEYAAIIEIANKATGADRKSADAVIANTRYGLIPAGPVRRAAVFGGSNIHIFNPDVVDGRLDTKAALAFISFSAGPEWSTKLAWDGSNPGNLRGFRTIWMKQRLEQIKFLNVTTAMLPFGVPFPVVPQSTQIMNTIVPDMLQNALTRKKTVAAAAADAAQQIKNTMKEL